MSAGSSHPVTMSELTASGPGGVSVLALDGPGSLELLASWGAPGLEPGELRFARIEVDGEALDEVLICVHSNSAAELHVHGSPPLVRRLLSAAPRPAFDERAASVAERARRALHAAPCELAARVLLEQQEGAWGRECRRCSQLPDGELAAALGAWSLRSEELRRAFEPARVLIAGPVNAGKSTLFNLLVGSERAIISDEAGTTRDLIVERAQLGPWPVLLVDSAGERGQLAADAKARVERRGQRLAQAQFAEADWILWLTPPGAAGAPQTSTTSPWTALASCSDLPGGDPLGISVLDSPAQALARVAAEFSRALGLPGQPRAAQAAVAFDRASRRCLQDLLQISPSQARSELAQQAIVEETARHH